MTTSSSKKRGMKRGFTLIELMVAIATIAVLIALLLPEIQKAQDASLKGKQKEGPYWVYREYEYAGGPVITEISGSYKHSLQEILDMYAVNLKQQQKAHEQDLLNDTDSTLEETLESEVDELEDDESDLEYSKLPPSKRAEKIARAKRALRNFKFDLSRNTASLVARRNLASAIAELKQDLKRLGAEP